MKLILKLAPAIFLILLVATACDVGDRTKETGYFQGHQGIVMTLTPGSLPHTIYYYPDSVIPGEPYEHMIELSIENKGASDSIGGVYISGFDPHMFEFERMYLDRVDTSRYNCDLDVAGILSDGLYGAISCDIAGIGDLFFGRDASGSVRFGGRSINLGNLLGIDYFKENPIYIDLVYDSNSGAIQFGLDIDIGKLGAGIYNYGGVLIAYATTYYGGKLGRHFIDERKGRLFKERSGIVMMGSRPDYPGGDLDYISFPFRIKNWPMGLDSTDQVFMITSCYAYTTFANPMICVDPYPDSPGRKACTPGTKTYPNGQGAPIAVTRVVQENTPRDIFFTIYFENKGRGIVYDLHQLEKCNPWYMETRVTGKDIDTIYLGQIRIEGDPTLVQCTPSRMVRLFNGKGQVTCKYPITYRSQSAYQTPLVIEAWYGYSETIQRTVRVRRG